MAFLHYSAQGSGNPLVILHGLFGSGKNWQSLARKFSSRYHVISVDLRNHGQSFHADSMNYDLMAQDVIELLNDLNHGPCCLLGHSMGGKVAMTVALKAPELLSKLVVVDIAPVAYNHQYDDLLQPLMALPLERISSRSDADLQLKELIPDVQLRSFLLQNLASDSGNWKWRVNWQSVQQNIGHITGFKTSDPDWTIDIPSLFLNGANSEFVQTSEREVIKVRFNDSRIVTISDAGHWLHAEKPEAFYQATLDFLDA